MLFGATSYVNGTLPGAAETHNLAECKTLGRSTNMAAAKLRDLMTSMRLRNFRSVLLCPFLWLLLWLSCYNSFRDCKSRVGCRRRVVGRQNLRMTNSSTWVIYQKRPAGYHQYYATPQSFNLVAFFWLFSHIRRLLAFRRGRKNA